MRLVVSRPRYTLELSRDELVELLAQHDGHDGSYKYQGWTDQVVTGLGDRLPAHELLVRVNP